MNEAFSKLLPLPGKPAPTAPQFLCQVTNVSECLPIQDQARVTTYMHSLFLFFLLMNSSQ